jgi:hypothetical protein
LACCTERRAPRYNQGIKSRRWQYGVDCPVWAAWRGKLSFKAVFCKGDRIASADATGVHAEKNFKADILLPTKFTMPDRT